MYEHGIFTTKVDYFVHLFPLKWRVFWYRREHCQYYIHTHSLEPIDGHSKDGSVTARGYLIPQRALFVANAIVPNELLCGIAWNDLTDRDCTNPSELIISIMIERNLIRFPISRCFKQPDKQSQFDGIDFVVRYNADFTLDVKCERMTTDNLFVQSHEENHRVHLVADGGSVREKITPAPWESMWRKSYYCIDCGCPITADMKETGNEQCFNCFSEHGHSDGAAQ